jgi:hypothetical protein
MSVVDTSDNEIKILNLPASPGILTTLLGARRDKILYCEVSLNTVYKKYLLEIHEEKVLKNYLPSSIQEHDWDIVIPCQPKEDIEAIVKC